MVHISIFSCVYGWYLNPRRDVKETENFPQQKISVLNNILYSQHQSAFDFINLFIFYI